MHFDARLFRDKFRMQLGHLAVEQKRRIGVKSFLQCMKLFIGTIPSVCFVHHQNRFVRLRVMRDDINDGDVGTTFEV
jgi:hypothetical protein